MIRTHKDASQRPSYQRLIQNTPKLVGLRSNALPITDVFRQWIQVEGKRHSSIQLRMVVFSVVPGVSIGVLPRLTIRTIPTEVHLPWSSIGPFESARRRRLYVIK